MRSWGHLASPSPRRHPGPLEAHPTRCSQGSRAGMRSREVPAATTTRKVDSSAWCDAFAAFAYAERRHGALLPSRRRRRWKGLPRRAGSEDVSGDSGLWGSPPHLRRCGHDPWKPPSLPVHARPGFSSQLLSLRKRVKGERGRPEAPSTSCRPTLWALESNPCGDSSWKERSRDEGFVRDAQ